MYKKIRRGGIEEMNKRLLLFLIMLLVISVFGCELKKTSAYIPLKQMAFKNNIEGSFFLGSGSIGNVPYFYCYIILPDKSYKMLTYRCIKSTIKEDDGRFLEIIEKTYDNDPLPIIRRAIRGNNDYVKEVVFHIPKNSIKNSFNANLD